MDKNNDNDNEQNNNTNKTNDKTNDKTNITDKSNVTDKSNDVDNKRKFKQIKSNSYNSDSDSDASSSSSSSYDISKKKKPNKKLKSNNKVTKEELISAANILSEMKKDISKGKKLANNKEDDNFMQQPPVNIILTIMPKNSIFKDEYSEEDSEEDSEENSEESSEEDSDYIQEDSDESSDETSQEYSEDDNDGFIKQDSESIEEDSEEDSEQNIARKIFERDIKEQLKSLKKSSNDNKPTKMNIDKDNKKKIHSNLVKLKEFCFPKSMSEFSYFKEHCSLEEQDKILNSLENINKLYENKKPYFIKLLESNIPDKFKTICLKKINSLRSNNIFSGENTKLKTWVDTFMQIPFGKYSKLPININDGMEKTHDFILNSMNKLNEVAYGLDDAKMQIMQLIGQLITNPESVGTSIALQGPMGTGKTTLIKEGISKILNREFAFIALGGSTDSAFLEGHSYTYEGSTWGKIVDILIHCKTMNPIIYFDELDKVSATPKGDEIIGILTHLTDTSQNSEFHDKYFSEIEFDLSKCLFIFSYNDESAINPILKDRMYTIKTNGYNKKDKVIISKDYLIPKIIKQVNISYEDVIINDEVIEFLISNYTSNEQGVRNLKRCLEIIYTKLNLYRLVKPGTKMFTDKLTIKFPLNLNNNIIRTLIKENTNNNINSHMYL